MEILQNFLDSPLPFAALVVSITMFFGSFLIASEVILEKMRLSQRKAYWAGRKHGKSGPKTPADYAADQLKKVSEARFVARALLNASEAKVFDTLDKAVSARNPQWQVMAQVSLGEFLASADKDAFLAVNSKRVDFALMDANCCVRHAIEYQGSGHHTGTTAAARDAIKKEALRKAGIGYHEVVAGHTTPSELRALVEKLVPNGRGRVAALREAASR
ncbi:MAG: DUF2726 domain-containing protein [Erythrobacter sp.]|nr:DUF2726 domain-containing protein [Erythrobacter sp.]MDZ4274072.1 DUF2726 domain-containing protein [Erythrobacter sp.]